MAADTKHGEGEWLDIPDPLAGDGRMRASTAAARPRVAPSEPSPTRADLKRRRLVALVGSTVWAAVVLALFGFRQGLATSASFVASQTIVWAMLLASALVLSIRGGRRGLGGPLTWSRAITIALPILFVVLALVWLPAGTATSFGAMGPVARILSCFLVGIAAAAPMVLVAFWAVRRSFPSAAGWRGALLGAASGLAASIVLTLHCGSPDGGHIAVAHGLPIVVSAIVGALLGVKLARA